MEILFSKIRWKRSSLLKSFVSDGAKKKFYNNDTRISSKKIQLILNSPLSQTLSWSTSMTKRFLPMEFQTNSSRSDLKYSSINYTQISQLKSTFYVVTR